MSLTPKQRAIKKKWVTALESGKYRQEEGTLYNVNTGGFCCLGVLQHVTMGGNVEAEEVFGGFHADPEDRCKLEPQCVPSDAYYEYIGGLKWVKENSDKLISMNDDQEQDFKQIARFIRENWK